MRNATEIEVVRRRIGPEQRRRRRRIVAEATRLIAEHGGAISMETVAAAADVSRTTLYRYYTSREHLLAEVTLAAGHGVIAHLQSHPPPGATVGERVESLCRMLTALAGENEPILASCVANLSSEDPAVLGTYREIEALVSGFFDTVLGDLQLSNRSMIQTTVFRYLLGSFILATTGKLDFDAIASDLTAVCRSLLREVWSTTVRPAARRADTH